MKFLRRNLPMMALLLLGVLFYPALDKWFGAWTLPIWLALMSSALLDVADWTRQK